MPINKTGDGIVMATKIGAERGPVSFIGHLGTEGKGIKFLSNLYAVSWQPFNLWVNLTARDSQTNLPATLSAKPPTAFMLNTTIMAGPSSIPIQSTTA